MGDLDPATGNVYVDRPGGVAPKQDWPTLAEVRRQNNPPGAFDNDRTAVEAYQNKLKAQKAALQALPKTPGRTAQIANLTTKINNLGNMKSDLSQARGRAVLGAPDPVDGIREVINFNKFPPHAIQQEPGRTAYMVPAESTDIQNLRTTGPEALKKGANGGPERMKNVHQAEANPAAAAQETYRRTTAGTLHDNMVEQGPRHMDTVIRTVADTYHKHQAGEPTMHFARATAQPDKPTDPQLQAVYQGNWATRNTRLVTNADLYQGPAEDQPVADMSDRQRAAHTEDLKFNDRDAAGQATVAYQHPMGGSALPARPAGATGTMEVSPRATWSPRDFNMVKQYNNGKFTNERNNKADHALDEPGRTMQHSVLNSPTVIDTEIDHWGNGKFKFKTPEDQAAAAVAWRAPHIYPQTTAAYEDGGHADFYGTDTGSGFTQGCVQAQSAETTLLAPSETNEEELFGFIGTRTTPSPYAPHLPIEERTNRMHWRDPATGATAPIFSPAFVDAADPPPPPATGPPGPLPPRPDHLPPQQTGTQSWSQRLLGLFRGTS
ncbi:unnamed protein product [Amoebophrya sp. A120]|nr:unnamed protein product [Amoebophrya sp. A120]|eukprot:GSA120T00006665001.1